MKKAEEKTTKKEVTVMTEPITVLDKKLYNSLVKTIDREYKKTEMSYLKIATTLYRIHKDGLFILDDYKNIYDLGSERFNLARGTVNNFINLVNQFCMELESGEYVISEGYDDFSSSQLIAMLGMPDDFISSMKADMSVRAIKDKKREYKQLLSDTAGCEALEDSESESAPESAPESASKKVKTEKMDNPCFVFETDDFSDFTDSEKVSIIEDAYNDFAKANKGKKVKFRLYLEAV